MCGRLKSKNTLKGKPDKEKIKFQSKIRFCCFLQVQIKTVRRNLVRYFVTIYIRTKSWRGATNGSHFGKYFSLLNIISIIARCSKVIIYISLSDIPLNVQAKHCLYLQLCLFYYTCSYFVIILSYYMFFSLIWKILEKS